MTVAYDRWAAGRCPCCGAGLADGPGAPVPIAEGVMVCAYCRHHTDDHLESATETREIILTAIVAGASET